MGSVENILLTGATGFLGHHLIRKLTESGYKVYALVRKSSNTEKIKGDNVFIHYIEEGIISIFQKNQIDCIIHTATSYGQKESIPDVLEVNLLLPLRLIEEGLANDVKVFINTDSFFTKSKGNYSYLNTYTHSKESVVSFLKSYANRLTVINCKLEHIYGENDGPAKFVTQIIKRLINAEQEIDLTEGTQKRDFVYVEDVVEAYLKIIQSISHYKGFVELEIGTGKSVSIRDFVIMIKDLTNSPSKLNFGALPTRTGEFEESKANINMINQIGWQTKYTLEQGLKKTIENEKHNYAHS